MAKNDKQMLLDIMLTETQKILNNNTLIEYLDIQSKFFLYSVGNTLLIKKQMPNATKVADKEAWQKLSIEIEENIKPIKILQPIIHEDNTTEFVVKDVYDESQTDYKFKIDMIDKKILLKSLLVSCPIQGIAVDTISNTDKKVYYDENLNKLYISRNLEQNILFNELIREIVYIKLSETKELDNIKFKTECISYMILKYYDIKPVNSNIEIPENFKKLSNYDFRKELERIRSGYESIITKTNDIIYIKNKDSIER